MTAASAKFALFDLDDTLVDTATPFGAFCREFVLTHGLSRGDAAADARTAQALAARIISHSWQEFCDRAAEWYGISTPSDELFAWVVATYPARFTLDPRVVRGLAALRADGWRLGIVTNGPTALQQAKIETVALRGHVDFIIDSEAAGARKPDRRIFEKAAEGLGVQLGGHGWMVGDNHACDIVGGHGAGVRTIWLPYAEQQPEDVIRPDHACATVLAAIEIIGAGAASE